MIYRCCDRLRRDAVDAHPTLNGIDYLEVVDRELPDADPLRQRTLLVYCLKPIPAGFKRDNIRLSGGERVKNIEVEWARPALPLPTELNAPGETAVKNFVAALPGPQANVLVVRVAEPGDFSAYQLRFAVSATDDTPPPNFDPQLYTIDFSFKVECPSDFDCRQEHVCAPSPSDAPDINYLAKDYGSFRRLMLDRMSQIVPQWRQSSVADYGIALVEMFAYIGDQLSYQQDAIATEAYLDTARQRVSLRRHALLVDYPMHDGCNARAWVQIEVAQGAGSVTLGKLDAQGKVLTQFLTRCRGFATGIESGSSKLRDAMLLSPLVFEPVPDRSVRRQDDNIFLHEEHNEMPFYTWGDKRCCLLRGATSATLAGTYPSLRVGDLLLFEEVVGSHTCQAGDADPAHRHAVRLTSVRPKQPDLPNPPVTLTDPLTGSPITEIAWALEDALPFALCVSDCAPDPKHPNLTRHISVARGNLVLVDHGRTINDESLGSVPAPTMFVAPNCNDDYCAPTAPVPIPVRYRPSLRYSPLTQVNTIPSLAGAAETAAPRLYDPTAPAAEAMDWDMANVLPQISLTSSSTGSTRQWLSHRTLLNSDAEATDFVVEVNDDGLANLRFGDDEHGQRPASGANFVATYRIGNGRAGNVGAGSIAHIVASGGDIANISAVRNPLAANGGVDPESADSVRRNAPEAFRTQKRAVTPEDYQAVTERYSGVQRAAATQRWTGSWYTTFITVDAEAGIDPTELKTDLAPFVDRYRMAGQDLEFNDPRYVPLEIGMHVCVQPDYLRSEVKKGLQELFSARMLADGRRGLFHPDNFTFGQTVYLSPLYAAAHAVSGVVSVQIDTFQRQGTAGPGYLADGSMRLGRLEIARLENSLNFPEGGVLRLDIHGGK
jgi:hypothetical protein